MKMSTNLKSNKIPWSTNPEVFKGKAKNMTWSNKAKDI